MPPQNQNTPPLWTPHCQRDTNNHGTELAMKAVRQARLELSGGSTPDQLKPSGPPCQCQGPELN